MFNNRKIGDTSKTPTNASSDDGVWRRNVQPEIQRRMVRQELNEEHIILLINLESHVKRRDFRFPFNRFVGLTNNLYEVMINNNLYELAEWYYFNQKSRGNDINVSQIEIKILNKIKKINILRLLLNKNLEEGSKEYNFFRFVYSQSSKEVKNECFEVICEYDELSLFKNSTLPLIGLTFKYKNYNIFKMMIEDEEVKHEFNVRTDRLEFNAVFEFIYQIYKDTSFTNEERHLLIKPVFDVSRTHLSAQSAKKDDKFNVSNKLTYFTDILDIMLKKKDFDMIKKIIDIKIIQYYTELDNNINSKNKSLIKFNNCKNNLTYTIKNLMNSFKRFKESELNIEEENKILNLLFNEYDTIVLKNFIEDLIVNPPEYEYEDCLYIRIKIIQFYINKYREKYILGENNNNIILNIFLEVLKYKYMFKEDNKYHIISNDFLFNNIYLLNIKNNKTLSRIYVKEEKKLKIKINLKEKLMEAYIQNMSIFNLPHDIVIDLYEYF